MANERKIYLISDSTGELGERFINALLSQFPGKKMSFEKFNFVQTPDEVNKAIENVTSSKNTILFHTVLSDELKKTITAAAKKRLVACFDLTGPPTQFMIDYLKVTPVWDIGSLHPLDATYDRRIEAIEFTISHDDGAGLGSVKKADAILVGPSRVSKTPTSMYLALKGFCVANIPLIQELGEPVGLSSLKNNKRVFGLDINPEKLRDVRLKRVSQMGSDPANYVDPRAVSQEMRWARQIYQKYEWKCIDVTDRAIEETAALIIKEIGKSLKKTL